jgi:hypothetical protein
LSSSVGDNGAYILSPRSGDFSEITYLFANLFGTPQNENDTETKKPKEKIKVTILAYLSGRGKDCLSK